jgi:biotin transport system substrate-specific component
MIARLTVADIARPSDKQRARLYDVALVVGGSVVIALCAQVAVGYPVPMTGQTFAVLMAAALLGGRRAVWSVLTYIAEGLLGLPVFAQGKAGLPALLGPTGGYLVGFVAAAYVVGALAERGWDRHAGTTILAMIFGNLTIYVYGLSWLAVLVYLLGRGSPGRGILAVGLYPFLLGDGLKIILAAILLPSGWRLIRHFGLENRPRIR